MTETATRASVATEMEAIFGAAAGGPVPAREPVGRNPLALGARRRRGIGPAAIAGALVLAAGAGVFALSSHRAETPARPVVSQAPILPPAVARPPAAPMVARPVVPAPVAATPAPVVVAPAEPVSTAAEPKPAPMRKPAPSRRIAEADDGYDDDAPRAAPRGGPCGGLRGGRRYACTLDALAAADGRLRRAYDSAVVTGVPRRVLLEVRERWASLRRSARERPFFVIQSYDALTDRLEMASSRAQ